MLRGVLGCLSDEVGSFQRQHHPVNRRWADAEIFLHVGCGRRPAMRARIDLHERQGTARTSRA